MFFSPSVFTIGNPLENSHSYVVIISSYSNNNCSIIMYSISFVRHPSGGGGVFVLFYCPEHNLDSQTEFLERGP